MDIRKKIFFASCGIILLVVSFLSRHNFAYGLTTVRNDVNRTVRNVSRRFIVDESPGVGPGNTPPTVADPEHFSFVVLGDTQLFNVDGASSDGFVNAMKRLQTIRPDLVMTVGDLVESCESADDCASFRMWKNIVKPFLPITYEVEGNHDRYNADSTDNEWRKYFNLPTNGPAGYEERTYSFDVGNSHFIVLASDFPKEHTVDQKQLDWLKKDLSGNKRENTFVFFHEPAFPMSYKVGSSLDVNPKRRDALWSILDEFAVTAVFNGHEHIYSREIIEPSEFPQVKHSVPQIIIGNTDASDRADVTIGNGVDFYHKGHDFIVVSVNGKEITINTYAAEGGDPVDSFTLPN
ncbi:MAG: metallophosphoesterase [Candidatus Moraniibacteriota bacterium]